MTARPPLRLDAASHADVLAAYRLLIAEFDRFRRLYRDEDALLASRSAAVDLSWAAEDLQTLAVEVKTRVAASVHRRGWEVSGLPMRCGSCGDVIARDRAGEPWRVCGRWAEHEECHVDDPVRERIRREGCVAEDEWRACLEEANRSGPAEGDLVTFTLADGGRVRGVWTVTDGWAGVLSADGQFHRHQPGGALRVVELAGDVR